jgi:hypothetical protein
VRRTRVTDLAAGAAALAAVVLAAAATAADAPAPAPDFAFFKARVEPVLQTVCSQCHAGKGKGRLALIVHAPGARFPDAEHRRNYETVLALVRPGDPDRSPFLQKPLAGSTDGVKHEGGDRIFRGTATHRAWVDFINGVALPAGSTAPEAVRSDPSVATVADAGTVLDARAMDRAGDLVDAVAGEGRRAAPGVAPGTAGGTLRARFRVARPGLYAVVLRASGADRGAHVRFDGGDAYAVRAGSDAPSDARPGVLCDGGRPLDARAGTLGLEDGALRLSGDLARFLVPVDVPHARVEASFEAPPRESSVRLLFDLQDARNGKFAGLAAGGERFEMGVLEGGRPRVLASRAVPAGSPRERIAVDFVSGVAVARLDGRPILHVNFDRGLGAGRFGFEASGSVLLREVAAGPRGGDGPAHRTRFSEEGVVALSAGDHSLEVVLPPGGAVLHTVTLREAAR